jgi:UDP-N-acetyl-D-mannosaminuronic acid dehydrogenase
MLVNEGLPSYLVRRAAARYDLRKMTAAILGMTFKADSDDPRDSLSYKLRKGLAVECKEVLCCDPFLSDDSLVPVEEALRRADIVFIGAPHTAWKDLDFGNKPVVDIWNSTRGGTAVL